jgi:hypothetical protein
MAKANSQQIERDQTNYQDKQLHRASLRPGERPGPMLPP